MEDRVDMRGRKKRENRLALREIVIRETNLECDAKAFNEWYKDLKKRKRIADEEVVEMAGIERTKLYRLRNGAQKLSPVTALGFFALLDDDSEMSKSEFMSKIGAYKDLD